MSKQQFGKIGSGVGFPRPAGNIKKAVTRNHTNQDINQTFIDNFGRTYIYTKKGLIY